MTFNILILIIVVTVAISLKALNDRELTNRLIFSPHEVKHYNSKYRIFSHIFIHANLTHLGFNMAALYFLGNPLLLRLKYEYGNLMGEFHFFTLYFLGALFATIIPYVRNQDNPSYRSLGASGAVSAVIFAFILMNPGQDLYLLFIPFPIPAFIFGPMYLLFEFIMDKRGGTGIAHDAHIGGALFGIVYVLIINIDTGKNFLEYISNVIR